MAASAHAAAFFQPGAPPPSFVPTPDDAALAQRVAKLVEFAARNGPSFVDLMRRKQADNPEYAFLQGGPGADYYTWALYCALHGLEPSQPTPLVPAGPAEQPPAGAAPAPADTSAALASTPAEVTDGWRQVLGLLTGSRDSIRNSQAWFMACAPYAEGMAEMMLQHALALADYTKQLHVIYLANDILFKSLSAPAGAPGGAEAVAAAFRPRLGPMLARAYASAGKTAEARASLARVVGFWAERGVYPAAVAEELTTEMVGVGPEAAGQGAAAPWAGGPAPAGAAAPPVAYAQQPAPPRAYAQAPAPAYAQAPAPAYAQAPPLEYTQAPPLEYTQAPPPEYAQAPYPPAAYPQPGAPPHFPPGAFPPGAAGCAGAPPPGYAPVPGQPGPVDAYGRPLAPYPGGPPPPFDPGMPPHPHPTGGPHPGGPLPGPPPEQQTPSLDVMSFPPGLLPKLVDEWAKVEPPYTPLPPGDVGRLGVPPPPRLDAYLTSRLSKFRLQLEAYRPGMLFSDLEADQPRRKHFSDREPLAGSGGRPADDGAYKGGPAGKAKGLGYGSEGGPEGGPEGRGGGGGADVFSSYRQMRSRGYHDMIIRSAAGKFG